MVVLGPEPQALPDACDMSEVLANVSSELLRAARASPAQADAFNRTFRSAPSRALIADAFWFAACTMLRPAGRARGDDAAALRDRAAAAFVRMRCRLAFETPEFGDFVLDNYFRGAAQSLFLVFWQGAPGSRFLFKERFQTQLLDLMSEWTQGYVSQADVATDWAAMLATGKGGARKRKMSKSAGAQQKRAGGGAGRGGDAESPAACSTPQ